MFSCVKALTSVQDMRQNGNVESLLLFTALFNSTPSGLITLQGAFNISCAHAICTSQFNTS